jgi:hypothetical protein
MSPSKHLWPDPTPDSEWEVWSEDTFDREARPTMDTRGKGLLDGLTALWIRFLLETARYEGNQGFTRFYLRRPPAAAINIKGSSEGAKRLRHWVFGTKKREIRNYLKVADRWLLEVIISIHAGLLGNEQSSEPILNIAAEEADQQGFESRMVELAGSLGIDISQPARMEARRLKPLAYSEKQATHQVVKKYSPATKPRYGGRATATSWRRILRNADNRLIGALMFLMMGLFFLFITGHGFTLSCERVEPNQVGCTHQKTWMGLITIRKQPVEGLWRARAAQVCNDEGCSTFPELDASNGPIRLESGSSDLSPNQDIVDKINAFLDDPALQDFEVAADFRPTTLILPVILILAGFGCFFAWIFNRLRQPR